MFSKIISIFLIYLSVFSCLIPGAGLRGVAQAAYAPSQAVISIGGCTFDDLDNLIVLIGRVTANTNHTTMRTMNGSSGYTPSGSKNFRVWAAKGTSSSASAGNAWQILYSDNDVIIDTGTALTNPVSPGGMSAASSNPYLLPMASSVGGPPGTGEICFGKNGFLVPNGKYLNMIETTSAGAFGVIYGYEE